uniref:Zgc:113208 n=1 Tax=Sinocyclocheilus grahami TaxID=75366 RepID=A0A672QDS3_SINGR
SKDKDKGKKNQSAHSTGWSEDDKRNNSDGGKNTSEIKRYEKGQLVFKDYLEFTPNMTPKEVLQAGSFGGTYFRPIYSKQHYKDVWQELLNDWLDGINISKQVASSTYRENVNTYKVKCGGSQEMWESSGWIVPQDPYGWFQWYFRFYQGRRTEDDARQISRWAKCAGVKGRCRSHNLITKVVRSGCAYDNPSVSPVEGTKRVKLK